VGHRVQKPQQLLLDVDVIALNQGPEIRRHGGKTLQMGCPCDQPLPGVQRGPRRDCDYN
jgi:hypothetical protein